MSKKMTIIQEMTPKELMEYVENDATFIKPRELIEVLSNNMQDKYFKNAFNIDPDGMLKELMFLYYALPVYVIKDKEYVRVMLVSEGEKNGRKEK